MNSKLATLVTVAAMGIAATAQASVYYGDALIERTYASDYPVGQGQTSPVIVIPGVALPTGVLVSFSTWDQVEPGPSGFPSAGNKFTAFIFRPTGNPNEFTEVFNSGLLTVPVVPSSQVVNYGVLPFAVQTGDRIAYYGQGVPVDVGGGTDQLIYPAGPPPALNSTFTLGDPGFPLYSQDRFYSFGANISAVPETSTIIAGALLLLPFGMSAIRALRKQKTTA